MGNIPEASANRRLGISLTSQVIGNSLLPYQQRTKVLLATVVFPESIHSQLYQILLVTQRSVELYCLIEGQKHNTRYIPKPNTKIKAAVHSRESIRGNALILYESDGCINVIDVYSLRILHSLNSQTQDMLCMISAAPDLLYVGHGTGVIKAWHISGEVPMHEFNAPGEVPSVVSLSYSHKHRVLVSGHEGEGPLRIYSTNALGNSEPSLLWGLQGTADQLLVVEEKSFLVALCRKFNRIHVWDFLTQTDLISFEIPQLGETKELGIHLEIIELKQNKDVLLVGLDDGCVLVSELELDTENLSLTWTPQKKISPKLNQEIYEEVCGVSFLGFNPHLDLLLIGNLASSLTVVSNFLYDSSHIDLFTSKEVPNN